MPLASMKPCSKVGCNKLTRKQYCEDHAKLVQQRYDKERGTAAKRGYDSRRRKARIGFLRKHPLCVYCFTKGLIVEANVVDHITPHKGDKVLFWDRSNWHLYVRGAMTLRPLMMTEVLEILEVLIAGRSKE